MDDAPQAWINEAAHEPGEQARRSKSDFLAYQDGEGRKLDFYVLRHTTGAWLAMAGVHPKKIQRVMRHSTIMLTMDTYGYLFRNAEAETIDSMPDVSSPKRGDDASNWYGQRFSR